MLTFKDLIDEVGRRLGNTDLFATGNEKRLASVKLGINVIQEQCNKDPLLRNMLLRKGRFLTVPEVTTGTVNLTRGSKNISFSNAILTTDFIDRLFLPGDNPDTPYRIASFSSATAGKLDAPYAGNTSAASQFSIHKDRYYLDRSVSGVWNVVDRTNGNKLKIRNPLALSDPATFDVETGDKPDDVALIKTLHTYFDNGTVAVSNGSENGTRAAGGLIPEMDGLAIRIDGDNVNYTFNYVSATAFTLDRAYEGPTNSTASFKLGPPGQWQIELHERPTTGILIDYDYFYRLPKLVNDNDISIITTLDDNVLWRGAIWAVMDDEQPGGAPAEYHAYMMAKRDMAEAVGELLPEVSEVAYKDV